MFFSLKRVTKWFNKQRDFFTKSQKWINLSLFNIIKNSLTFEMFQKICKNSEIEMLDPHSKQIPIQISTHSESYGGDCHKSIMKFYQSCKKSCCFCNFWFTCSWFSSIVIDFIIHLHQHQHLDIILIAINRFEKNSNRWSSVKHSENNIIIIKEYSDYFCSFFVLRERCLSLLWYGKAIWKVEPKPVSLSSFALNWFFFSLIFSLFSPQALPVYLFCFDPCLSVCNMKMCFVCANRSRSLSMIWCRWWSRENSLCVCVCEKFSFASTPHSTQRSIQIET